MAKRIGRAWAGVKALFFAGALAALEDVSYLALKRHGQGIDGMPTVV